MIQENPRFCRGWFSQLQADLVLFPVSTDGGARPVRAAGSLPMMPEVITPRPRSELATLRSVVPARIVEPQGTIMLLQTVRPNIVQSIRAFRVDDLLSAAQDMGHHFLYANLSKAQSKQEVLECIAEAFLFPSQFGKSLDALHDCMTDTVYKSGAQQGFIVVLEQLPDNAKFDREAREQLLDIFRDTADFWGERKIPFRCFYSFQ